MFVLWCALLSLHDAHKGCDVRPAHEQPSQCTQQASVAFVHLRIAVALGVQVVHVPCVNL
eukprot:8585258-Prorocentrum_lima.AAC.1